MPLSISASLRRSRTTFERLQVGGHRWVQDGEVQTDEDENGEDRVAVLDLEPKKGRTRPTVRGQDRKEEPKEDQREGKGSASSTGPSPNGKPYQGPDRCHDEHQAEESHQHARLRVSHDVTHD